MADYTLRYRTDAEIGDLAVGECVARPADHQGTRYWNLWFRVERADTGEAMMGRVPFVAGFPKTGPEDPWQLTRTGFGAWQVSPSIAVSTAQTEAGEPHSLREAWHKTPAIVNVPEPPPWES